MEQPLEGIKVVEVAMWAFVPAAGGMLSDMGAEVIKVEPPTGDPIRALTTGGSAPGQHGFALSYENYNRGKRSIALNLKADGAVEVLHRLLDKADVFLTNLLPPARRAMQIDIDDIRARHPDIIYAIGTGSGAHGPDAEKGGYDHITFWSRGGVAASVTPEEVDYPLMMPTGAYGDCTSALALVAGVTAAIAQRARTGKASVVDASLLSSGMWVMQRAISQATLQGVERLPKVARNQSPNPLVNVYRTSDGRFLALCMLQGERFWPGFCAAVGRPDLAADPRFATEADRARNLSACVAAIDAVFAARPLEAWKEALATQDGQWDVVQEVGELHADHQVVANDFMQWVEYEDGRRLKIVSTPIQFDRQALKPRAAPDVGADSDAILTELGYDEQEIIDLRIADVLL